MKKPKYFAFVLMPFSPDFNDVYKFGIKEPARALDIQAERVDEQIYSEGILDRIYKQIDAADIIIADMTGQNVNVFYEVGYAHGRNKLCILLTQNSNDIPFDLKHRRHIVYDGSIEKLKTCLTDDLEWAKAQIDTIRKSKINLEVKEISGKLIREEYRDFVNLKFKIDLLNQSSSTSANVQAIYLYSGKDWQVFQDGKECSSTHSDVPEFLHRYFLTPPTTTMPKESWAQLKFEAKRLWASMLHGDSLKDSYKIAGRAMIRLATSEGNFDYTVLVDVVAAEDFPF